MNSAVEPDGPESNAPSSGDATAGHAAVGEGDLGVELTNPGPEQELAQALSEKAELWDRCLRLQAEFENYRKRAAKERDEERRYAALPFIRDLLPTLDNLSRAIDVAREQSAGVQEAAAGLRQGVEMVLAQAVEVLQRHGAEPIPAVGQLFDPNVHEALQQVPTAEHPPMTIVLEYERGYRLHDRVIRPSKVIVAVAPPS